MFLLKLTSMQNFIFNKIKSASELHLHSIKIIKLKTLFN